MAHASRPGACSMIASVSAALASSECVDPTTASNKTTPSSKSWNNKRWPGAMRQTRLDLCVTVEVCAQPAGTVQYGDVNLFRAADDHLRHHPRRLPRSPTSEAQQ